jgi:hypothetical protein
MPQTWNRPKTKKLFGLFWNSPFTSIAPQPSHKHRPGVRRQTVTFSSLSEFSMHPWRERKTGTLPADAKNTWPSCFARSFYDTLLRGESRVRGI